MSRVIDTFQTTKGTQVTKRQKDNGQVIYQANGQFISPQSYASYASHKPDVEKFKRGNLADIEDTDSLGFPYDSRTFKDISTASKGSEKRVKIKQNNQWVGFLADENTPNNPFEATEEYQAMVSELQGVDSEQRRQEIKEKYNIGGS